jgi:hypothetical protein
MLGCAAGLSLEDVFLPLCRFFIVYTMAARTGARLTFVVVSEPIDIRVQL